VTTFPLPEHTVPSILGDVAFVEIFSLNVDSGQEINLTPKLHENVRSVSPDGKKLACISLRSKNYGLWVMNDDGTNQIQLTPYTYGDRAPEFSPDGKKIVFWGIFEIQPDIFIIDVDGTHLTRLTESHYQDVYPSWSPDGTKIIFESERAGNFDIWQMFLDAPITVNVEFEKSAVPGEISNATMVIQNTSNDMVQIDKIGLRFDCKKENEIIIPISNKKDLTNLKDTFKAAIPFSVQKNAELGYHYYDVIVQYSIITKDSQQSKTYEHTARDLKVGNLEEAGTQILYQELNTELNQRHETAINKSISLGITTSEVATPLKGYFDYLLNPNAKPFLEANDEFYKAKNLYLAENYTGASTHLQKVENLIIEQPSVTETSKTPNNALMIVAILPIAFLFIFLVFHTRKKGKKTLSNNLSSRK
jgi:dipeptidyl aminopeptidase/acylaminoacyl peptidase